MSATKSATKKNVEEYEPLRLDDEDEKVQETFIGKIVRITNNYVLKPFLIGTSGAFGVKVGNID